MIANELLSRLERICPTCNYSPTEIFLTSVSTACSSRDEVVLRAEVTTCLGNLQQCDFNTHLEHFRSIPSPFLAISNSTLLLLDRSCPLYASSAQSTECLTSVGFSAGVLAGGVVGGMVLGACIALCCVVVVVLVFVHIKRRRQGKKEMTPHPTSHNFPRKDLHNMKDLQAHHNKNSSDDTGYEYLPTFRTQTLEKSQQDEGGYDIPHDVVKGLPTATAANPDGEYIIPDAPTTGGSGSGSAAGAGGVVDQDKFKTQKLELQNKGRTKTYENVKKKGGATAAVGQPSSKGQKKTGDATGTGSDGSKVSSKLRQGSDDPTKNRKKAEPVGVAKKVAPSTSQLQGSGQAAATVAGGVKPPQGQVKGVGQEKGEEPEEDMGFKAMRNKLAGISGAKVVTESSHVQSSDGKKM